jgi:transcriptional regulator with XRE-family HTH domain
METNVSVYRYTESGLDNVMVHGVDFLTDDAGETVVAIPNILGLHRAIATAIVTKTASMTGKELRFLRTEMGMTQAELAAIVHREPLAISRWERGEVENIDTNAETLIRLHAREALDLDVTASVKDISAWSVPSASTPTLDIDGSNPNDYRPMPLAA